MVGPQEIFKEKLFCIFELLARRDYLELEKVTGGVRLHAIEIEGAVKSYGRTMAVPPLSHLELMDVIEIEGVDPKKWSISIPLWTMEEGRSDLTLEITVVRNNDCQFIVELDDIHVL